MRENCTSGSVRGAPGNRRSYRRGVIKPQPYRKADLVASQLMGKTEKVLEAVLRGTADANISFRGLCKLLITLGFTERVRGDHFIYTKPQIEEILNLQPIGGLAKAYQVKQVRTVIFKYKLGDLHGS